ncbi:tRNA (N(6)-L-threonylcarbamoyladenosine(37)-C(2))-methylthiotransferase [Candidatus Marsarchaeota archaeon]|jgi:MiaB-like tRNA modifying enzyme|nr:tRNA (N(6)-L-threonylcarbamoyladenosine(37)-C(2))-methylthiotransferase [Candidatus Marsarchaeota archaeon]MCL5089959.1 tRNA (N(6)-L-threonylcarbamoyladenosine(37)-C(2))-methylthiotransferase [Candidatus Marsarchaeota archaeon]
MQIYIKTYGCTLNQADSEIIKSILLDRNASICDNEKDADVVVINTCTVKEPTEIKILYKIRQLNKENKKMVITGCMAGANSDMLKRYAPNASIVSSSNIAGIGEVIDLAYYGKNEDMLDYKRFDKLTLPLNIDDVIAKIPISEGCLGNCSFCETKFARGPLNSFSEDLIIKAIENSIKASSKEIQLTAQDTGAYGVDRNTDIIKLLNRIEGIEGDFMLRLGMFNPEHFKRLDIYKLIDIFQSDKIYKFIHLPIQSGSNEVISHMGRNCSVEEFEDYVRILREGVKGISIETDIIVGYPTEKEEDFEATLNLIKKTKPDVTNISKFGKRPHTRASALKQLENSVIKNRSIRLFNEVRKVQYSINSKLIGKTIDGLITSSTPLSVNGRTDSYKQIVLKNMASNKHKSEIGKRVKVKVNAVSANVLYCEIV